MPWFHSKNGALVSGLTVHFCVIAPWYSIIVLSSSLNMVDAMG